jgi:NADH-quinone oxidoreductase subunit L
VLLLLMVLISAGWLLVFRSEAAQQPLTRRYRGAVPGLYALLSREFYVADLYSRAGEQMLSLSRRLNALLRWV